MLDQSTRTAILRLAEAGHGSRAIARALGVSRGAVKKVLRRKSCDVPRLERPSRVFPHLDEVVDLYGRCKGNLVRVHEELVVSGVAISYQALTAFCRRHGIGKPPPFPVGRYHFAPGEEMQHDTSPHDVRLGGVVRRVQTASLVLCYSRLLFFQCYPNFTRFQCKVFLTDALSYRQGACARCMIDNTHVVVLKGTGASMVPVPEMAAFAERFGFAFAAHEVGDANRSARVEGPFDHIENNFLAGREFTDWDHLNREALAWCDKVNATRKRHLHASPRELFAAEQPRLKPLPIWVPEVYALHQRIVDAEGYVTVHTNRYSVPFALIGRRMEVRETKNRIDVYDGPRCVASHVKVLDPCDAWITNPDHRPPRGFGRTAQPTPSEEQAILAAAPEISSYVVALKKRAGGRGTLVLRRLLRIVRDYPRAPLLEAIRLAEEYGLFDLERVERMVLRHVAHDYFLLSSDQAPIDRDADNEDDDDPENTR